MIIEYTYSQRDLRKKCYGCKYFIFDKESYDSDELSWYSGKCICETNKIKNRERTIMDKACSSKESFKER